MQKYRTGITILLLLTSQLISLQAQPATHTLQSGETLYSLSRTYGVSVDEIIAANGITAPENLSVGSQLLIPGQGSGNSAIYSEKSEYIVQKGDTFYRIARNHGLSVDELYELNDFSGSRILRPGESIIVSTSGRPVVVQPTVTRPETPRTPAVVETAPASVESYTESVEWPVEGSKNSLTGKLRGVRIEAAEASLVRSVASGNVVWTGPYRGFGQVVLIDVNGYIYLYGGNEDVFVNVGEYVSAGARIGRLGHSGLATRTVNMYFSVFKDGIPVSVVSAPRG